MSTPEKRQYLESHNCIITLCGPLWAVFGDTFEITSDTEETAIAAAYELLTT